MMWEDRYKKANDAIHPSEELKKKTIQKMVAQSEKKQKWGMPLKAAVSFACCALLVVGLYEVTKPAPETGENISLQNTPASLNNFDPSMVTLSNGMQVKAAVTKEEKVRAALTMENDLVQGVNTEVLDMLTIDVGKEVLNKQENAIFSPASLYFALSNAANLSQNETQNQYLQYLKEDSLDSLNARVSETKELLSESVDTNSLSIYDSIWLDENQDYLTESLQRLLDELNVESYLVDFEDEKTSELIGQWMMDKTDGLVGDNYQVPENISVSLLNTLLLKDSWVKPFSETLTSAEPFYGAHGQTTADFMHTTMMQRYIENDLYQAVSLRTALNKSFWVILPKESSSLSEVISQLDQVLNELDSEEIQSKEVILSLPKFSFESQLNLQEVMDQGNSAFIFDENADYSALSETMRVNSLNQSSMLSIDEKGIEAASVTEIGIEESAMLETEQVEMNVNRPFLVVIEDNASGVVLFTASVYDIAK